eukprot:2397091-Prymnesium_polylepis.3
MSHPKHLNPIAQHARQLREQDVNFARQGEEWQQTQREAAASLGEVDIALDEGQRKVECTVCIGVEGELDDVTARRLDGGHLRDRVARDLQLVKLAGGGLHRQALGIGAERPGAAPTRPVSYTHLRAHETLMNL